MQWLCNSAELWCGEGIHRCRVFVGEGASDSDSDSACDSSTSLSFESVAQQARQALVLDLCYSHK